MNTYENSEDRPLQNVIRDGGMMNIFRTIGCIGDSLASGEFEYWDNGQKGYWDFYEYSFGIFMNIPGESRWSASLVFQ